MKRFVYSCLLLFIFVATRQASAAPCASGVACLGDGRFEVTARFVTSDGVHAAVPLYSRGNVAYFSGPAVTGDSFNPEIAVRIVDFRQPFGGFLAFHAPLTHLPYEVTIRDTVSGETRVVAKEIDSHCGASDFLAAADALPFVAPPALATTTSCGDGSSLCLFGGRYRIRLLVNTNAGAPVVANALPYHDSFGAFSLPSVTGDSERAEVAVKLIDGYAVDGSTWLFHGALTHIPYVLEIADVETGLVRTVSSSEQSLCGGVVLGKLRSEPCRAATLAGISGEREVARGDAATLTAIVGGTPPFRFEWGRGNPDGTRTVISEAITSQFTTPPLDSSTAWDVAVSNGCGQVEASSVTVTVRPAVATLTIRKRGAGFDAITANVRGLNCTEAVGTCSLVVSTGTDIRLTASPSVDSSFSGWSGDCRGSGRCSVTVTGDMTLNARFEPARESEIVTPGGGRASLEGIGDVEFPPGSVPANTAVTLSATRDARSKADFDTTAILFSPSLRSQYEVRIATGAVAPTGDLHVRLRIPQPLLNATATGEIQLFAQILQDGGDEILDTFEPVPSDVSLPFVSATLPPVAFTDLRTSNGFEAVIVIAVIPTKPPAIASAGATGSRVLPGEIPVAVPPDAVVRFGTVSEYVAAPAAECKGSSLGLPLPSTAPITSPFNPANNHYGTDFGVPNGTSVLAMADGVVVKVGMDVQPLSKPHPRSGKLVRGWGRYVVVKHTDGSATLYAHLQTDGVKVQEQSKVTKGTLLATSDNSGGSSGPHLHVEYAPNGALYGAEGRASKVDPAPCIGGNVSGSITLRDNGSLADDAFVLFLNGIEICSTSIGASNTCAANNLRPGTITLTLKCTVAPDDVGTYEVTLSDGLTFDGGGTARSSTLPQGGSHSFAVIVPAPAP
jgi:murein DD-endopeptidase MepM/ murein hydrolase activator NlpD